jgi:hypothetical protein
VTTRPAGAAIILLVAVGLAASACGPGADLGSSPAADATAITDAADAAVTSEPTTAATAVTVSATDTAAAAAPTNGTAVDTPTGPSISAEEIQDIERTLDEIDQILGDLEADLAQDS